jgi:heptosyltransferase-2
VIRGGAIGDFILTLPALSALRGQFPEAHLEVLGYPHIAHLAVAGGIVDQVRSIEAGALAGFFARGGTLAEHLVDYFSDFDLIISYLYDPDDIFRINVARCLPGQFIAGPHRPSEREAVPAAKVFLQPLERLAIFDADPVPRLRIGPPKEEPVGGQARLVLHPGSGSERKNWPEKNWAELLELLVRETALHLLLVGGEAEGDRLQRLAAALPPERTRVAQSLPLAELAVLLQNSHAFVGHDSGITHLAAALGLPGLVLWGESNAAIWRPPSDKMVVLNPAGGLSGLTARQVLSELPLTVVHLRNFA